MWKPSKKTSFFIMILTAIMGGVTFSYINWENLDSSLKIYKEVRLPIIFLVLSVYFMIFYIKRIKEEKRTN